MTPQSEAQRIFNEYYAILFDSDSDKSEEILISVLAKKCAINHCDGLIKEHTFLNPITWNRRQLKFWNEVLDELNKM